MKYIMCKETKKKKDETHVVADDDYEGYGSPGTT